MVAIGKLKLRAPVWAWHGRRYFKTWRGVGTLITIVACLFVSVHGTGMNDQHSAIAAALAAIGFRLLQMFESRISPIAELLSLTASAIAAASALASFHQLSAITRFLVIWAAVAALFESLPLAQFRAVAEACEEARDQGDLTRGDELRKEADVLFDAAMTFRGLSAALGATALAFFAFGTSTIAWFSVAFIALVIPTLISRTQGVRYAGELPTLTGARRRRRLPPDS